MAECFTKPHSFCRNIGSKYATTNGKRSILIRPSALTNNDFFDINHLPDRTIDHNGRDYLFFSGTAYLSIPQNESFRQLLTEAMRQYGTVFGSSRNGNLRLTIYEKAEAQLADFASAPAALTLSSGMMAGQAVVNWLRSLEQTTQPDKIVYAPHTHPALWHGPHQPIPTESFTDWAAKLITQAHHSLIIFTNSLDAVRSHAYPFAWVNELPADRPITLVIDDSHGIGVTGEHGSGIWSQIPQRPNLRLIVTASLAKAMGLPGGVIFAEADTLAAIRQTAFFGGCSPIPPAYLYAFTQAGALYQQAQEKLRQNITMAEQLLLPTGLFQQAGGYPVFYTDHDDLYAFLLEQGIFIYSFAYPTAAHKANTRIVISAFHEPKDIERLALAVGEFVVQEATR